MALTSACRIRRRPFDSDRRDAVAWLTPTHFRRVTSQAGTGRTYLRRVAADSFRIGVVRNQSKSTVSRTMYKAMPKAMGTPITNSMTIRSGCGWCREAAVSQPYHNFPGK